MYMKKMFLMLFTKKKNFINLIPSMVFLRSF